MTLYDTLTTLFARKSDETENPSSEQGDPNSWGHYEYDGEVRTVARDRQIDVNHHIERHAFIRNFVVHHVDGIRLRNDGVNRPH